MPTCRFSLRRVKLNVFASDKKALRADFCSFFTIVIQSIADKTVLIAPVLIWRIATLSLGSAFVFFKSSRLVGHELNPLPLRTDWTYYFLIFWRGTGLRPVKILGDRMDSQGYMNGALQTLKLFHGPDSLYVCCPEGKASYLALFDIQNPCKNPISQSPSVLFFRTLAPIMHIRLPRIQNKTKNRQKKNHRLSLLFWLLLLF